MPSAPVGGTFGSADITQSVCNEKDAILMKDDLYYNAETEFIFNDKKYIISGWLNEDGTYTVALYSIEENSQELFSCTSRSRQDVVETFETAKIFDNRTIYDVEKDITVTYG